ncbi:MAG: hypothetical protein ACLSHU_03885 [Oscillospiraceae bacterium]
MWSVAMVAAQPSVPPAAVPGARASSCPKYVHIGPLMKMDGASKRKLSKRKDPELALTYYKAEGFPVRAVYEYVMTLAELQL